MKKLNTVAFIFVLAGLVGCSTAQKSRLPASIVQSIATCTGVDNFGYDIVLKLGEGTPIASENSPNSKYYAEISSYLSQKQIDGGAPLTTSGRLKSQQTSNPLQKTNGNPAVYWNGTDFETANFKLTIDGSNSLLDVPNTGPMASTEYVNVKLDCK